MSLRTLLQRVLSVVTPPTPAAKRTSGSRCTVADDSAAASLAAVLYAQRRWQLRKVESHLLREGSYSVTRVSIDCVPQSLDGLRYLLDDEPDDAPGGLLLVPITTMRKGTLHGFDMRDGAGSPMPVIGRSEYTELMIGMLTYEMGEAAVVGCDIELLARALTVIVDGDPEVATPAAVDLVVDGEHDGVPCLNVEEMSVYAANLVLSLANSYILIALLPQQQAGYRQVIKYEHHSAERLERSTARNGRRLSARWRKIVEDRTGSTGPVTRLKLAAGLEALQVSFDLSHPSGSASHHFEVHIPEGVRCERLSMPVKSGREDRNTTDTTPTGVAHAVATYEDDPYEAAVVEFRVPFEGLRQNAATICGITATMLLLGLLLPGAQRALLAASDGAAALLLAVPAVAFAFSVGGREHDIVRWMLRPLRVIVVGCALLLLACAGSIVGQLHDWARYPLWWLGATTTLATGVALAWTVLQVLVRRLREHDTDDTTARR